MAKKFTMAQEDFLRQKADAREKLAALAKLFPGCFHPDGRAIVASAHFPRLPQAGQGKENNHD